MYHLISVLFLSEHELQLINDELGAVVVNIVVLIVGSNVVKFISVILINASVIFVFVQLATFVILLQKA